MFNIKKSYFFYAEIVIKDTPALTDTICGVHVYRGKDATDVCQAIIKSIKEDREGFDEEKHQIIIKQFNRV